MRVHHLATLAACIGSLCVETSAQNVVVLSHREAQQQFQSTPVNSPKLMDVMPRGHAVTVDVTVGPDGRVIRAMALGGASYLVAPVVGSVYGWSFRHAPNNPTPPTIRTVVIVAVGQPQPKADLEALGTYADTLLRCAIAVEQGQFSTALASCENALDQESKLGRDLRQGPFAGLLYGIALVGADRPDDALEALARTNRLNRGADWSSIESALGHTIRARAERRRNPRTSAQQYSDADRFLERVKQFEPADTTLRRYSFDLQRQIQTEWASVLDDLGRTADAERLRSRLATLK